MIVLVSSGVLLACPKNPTTIADYPMKTYYVNELILFSGAKSHDNGPIYGRKEPKWLWDFNYKSSVGFTPSETATESTMEWVYNQSGTYIVAVKYVDEDGLYGNLFTMSITIAPQVSKEEAVYSYNNADQVITENFPSIIVPYQNPNNISSTAEITNSINDYAPPNLDYYYDERGRLAYLSDDNQSSYYESLGYEPNSNVNWQEFGTYNGNPQVNADFTYDGLSRLVESSGIEPNGTREETYFYDNDGNITMKDQDGHGYTYSYDFGQKGNNRLTSVTTLLGNHQLLTAGPVQGTTFNFTYDYKGNMISDQRKGITNIQYNYQNLPVVMQSTGSNFTYRYDDHGNRISKMVTSSQTSTEEYYLRDQTGREVAVYDVQTQKVKMFNLYGDDLVGRVNVTWGVPIRLTDENGQPSISNLPSYDRYYYLKDHLGNIIETVSESGDVVNKQYYYPYGGYIPNTSYADGGVANNKYKFTGKERDNETNYDYFGARFYDSEIGRWTSVDPKAEKYPGWSPYNYCMDNPIKYYDPNGMWVLTKLDGHITLTRISPSESKQIAWGKCTPGLIGTAVMFFQDFVNRDPSIGHNSFMDYAAGFVGAKFFGAVATAIIEIPFAVRDAKETDVLAMRDQKLFQRLLSDHPNIFSQQQVGELHDGAIVSVTASDGTKLMVNQDYIKSFKNIDAAEAAIKGLIKPIENDVDTEMLFENKNNNY